MQFAHFEFDPKEDLLGEGPLSEVYRAYDRNLDRTVALKILRAHAEIDPAADRRFQREARHTGKLGHPNIATVYEYGLDGDTAYIAMEFLEGRTLDKILKDRQLDFEECLRIAIQVSGALAYVHKQGLIHRDLKPANIMVQHDGTVKLLDFGIARASNESSITQHGMLVGTVLYMSPEQVRGEELDFRSDIFALGSVLYHMTTGQLPFPGKSFPEVCMAILDGRVRRPSQVRLGYPEPLERFVLRCLEPDPADRFQTGAEAHGALLPIAEQVRAGPAAPESIEGVLVFPPLDCGGSDPSSCHRMAGSLRKDLAEELGRLRGLEVRLVDSVPPDGGGADFLVRGTLSVEGDEGRLELVIEHYEDSPQGPRLAGVWNETIVRRDEDEWTLQADLVRAASREVRRRLTEFALKPSDDGKRNVERGRELSRRAHEMLLRGTTKHLMSAVSTFRRAIDEDPYCALAFAGLAEAMVRKYLYFDGAVEYLDEARENARRALALDPECAEAHTSLGFAYHLSGHPTDAQREYRIAIQLDNDEWLAHRLLGAILAREGNLKSAAPLLRRAIALHPCHIGSYDHLYNVLQRLGRYEEALEVADEGIAAAREELARHKDNQEARLHMAMLQARIGERERAREAVREALELAPKDGYTSYHAALVYAILGDVHDSLEQLTRARNRGFHVQSELHANPDLDPVRGLGEFQELLR